MARLSPLTILPPLLFAGLAALFYVGMNREDPDALPSTFVDRPAPDVTEAPLGGLPSFSRAALDAPGLKLVNFWASWCAPCRAEHPTLVRLGQDIPIYGVNQDRTVEDAMGFLDELGNPYTAVNFDKTKRQSIDWGVYGLPETFLIDGQGRVITRIVGPLTSRILADRLQPALDAARQD